MKEVSGVLALFDPGGLGFRACLQVTGYGKEAPYICVCVVIMWKDPYKVKDHAGMQARGSGLSGPCPGKP
jgi:hypothetical protein